VLFDVIQLTPPTWNDGIMESWGKKVEKIIFNCEKFL
jgi:hypothetical protein